MVETEYYTRLQMCPFTSSPFKPIKAKIHRLILACIFPYVSMSHHNSSVKYTEYPIEKLTFSSVYFNGRDGDSFNESYVILEEQMLYFGNSVHQIRKVG